MKVEEFFLRHKLLIGLTSTLILCLIGTWMYLIATEKPQTKNGLKQTTTDNVIRDNSPDNKQVAPTAAIEKTTKTLPSGKKIIYPNDEKNKNILWTVEGGQTVENILLSHDAIETFMTTVDSSRITEVCGSETNAKALLHDISVGILNTSTKQLTHPQNSSCIDLLASDSNTDKDSRTKAQEVLKKINEDVEHFIKTVAIE